MAKVLLLNPNRWGRGITMIWVASHAAALRGAGHEVHLFDATFYRDWAQDETGFNTRNLQYQPTEYDRRISFKDVPVRQALQSTLDEFQPDVVFWSALSSHIHGEGEYVNIQHGYDLMESCKTSALKVCGGLQSTANPVKTFARFPHLNYLMGGETEILLRDFVNTITNNERPENLPGLVHRNEAGNVIVNPRQTLIGDMDVVPAHDYSLFEDQVFLRPYNGHVVRAVDYEMSRGCIYSCSYCVETVIQAYYGFTETNKRGTIKNPKRFLRNKSAKRVMEEISELHHRFNVTLFRCQDTNFLTIDHDMLEELADLMDAADLPIQLYIETRPEGINPSAVALLKRLRVDGVGMGIELSTQMFRENNLNRFSDQSKIIRAFEMLREAGIRRTAYNIIGLPEQDEGSIIETIEFNRLLDPDNVTVAFYSPYLGTGQQIKGAELEYFDDYEYNVDSQLRTVSHHPMMTRDILEYYKSNFVRLVRGDAREVESRKRERGLIVASA